ncbi:MAG: hypothetical protein OEQ53_13595 [Saprospiraceae bacterium]|nr:hypothetical protein [Saprospiraceae bacterium]
MDPPVNTDADTPLADVYQMLDGTWIGTFIVYEDERGQIQPYQIPDGIDSRFLESIPLHESNRISVTQRYVSISPYFQKVEITDVYLDDSAEKRVDSYGVNKVENGQMWCIVVKPDERIVHQGKREGENTIIWTRDKTDPLKVEYFRETVLEDTYSIVGYGYYGEDDRHLSPKTWFLGRYHRKKGT